LDPYNYYIALLKGIPHCKSVEDYEKLLPWNIRSYTIPIITTADGKKILGAAIDRLRTGTYKSEPATLSQI